MVLILKIMTGNICYLFKPRKWDSATVSKISRELSSYVHRKGGDFDATDYLIIDVKSGYYTYIPRNHFTRVMLSKLYFWTKLCHHESKKF